MSNKGNDINNQVLRPKIMKESNFRQCLLFSEKSLKTIKKNYFGNTGKLWNSIFGMYTNNMSMCILSYIHLEKEVIRGNF